MSHTQEPNKTILEQLPGLDCGLCGSRTCTSFAETLLTKPQDLEKCIHLRKETVKPATERAEPTGLFCQGCEKTDSDIPFTWKDSLGRDYDFILDSLPGDPGPREIIIPHNPTRTKDLNVQKGDILIGRPMGMSCGCPITHIAVPPSAGARSGLPSRSSLETLQARLDLPPGRIRGGGSRLPSICRIGLADVLMKSR